ncbi:hypothetical protein SBADM41S_12369 [Streptomyces badius]
MIEVIAPIEGTGPQRCCQSSSARAMGSKGRLSGFGTALTLPTGHMPVSPVSFFGIGHLPGVRPADLGDEQETRRRYR